MVRPQPSRIYHARPFVAGELPEGMAGQVRASHICWTFIRRMGPGFRARVFIYLPDFATQRIPMKQSGRCSMAA